MLNETDEPEVAGPEANKPDAPSNVGQQREQDEDARMEERGWRKVRSAWRR